MKQIIKNILFTGLILGAVYFCIRYPAEIGSAVSLSMDRCINVIIPSMFIFMCLTSIAVAAGIHNIISVPFIPAARYIFRLKQNQFGIFLLSMFSGYPAGIKLLADSHRRNEISKKEFERLSCFCFAGGPAFISGTVSGILFPGTHAGAVCFISVTAGNLAAAFISGLFSPFPPKPSYKIRTDISAQNVINSTLSSAHAIFQMCVMIITFGGLYRAAELSGAVNFLYRYISVLTGLNRTKTQAIVSSFFEISNIVTIPANSTELLPIVSFLLSFGGICVLIQVIVISGGLLNVRKFLLSRLFSASVSALVCRIISRFFDLGTADVFMPATAVHRGNGTLTAVLLLIMTVMLLSLSKNYGQSD